MENQPDPLSLFAMREWLVKLSASGCLPGAQIERSAGVGRWIDGGLPLRFLMIRRARLPLVHAVATDKIINYCRSEGKV